MLTLRRGRVLSVQSFAGGWQRMTVDVDGEERAAAADVGLVGPSEVGDEVVVNTAAVDLELGSGGFDLVHVNLTRGLGGAGAEGAHVMKLNYTSLQHAVHPVEGPELAVPLARPAGVFGLHGQLAPVCWALGEARPGARVGFVQTAGGALPGAMSRVVSELRERGLLAAHVTAGPAYGGEREAISVAGALHHGVRDDGWDVAVCGPGPGILGSDSALGHGGMAALDTAHAAMALGCPTALVARMSSGDPRERHQGISHHTLTVLALLLGRVTLPLPTGAERQFPDDYRHEVRRADVDLPGYARSGLPATTMGRGLEEDPEFFAAALAAGTVLAGLAPERPGL